MKAIIHKKLSLRPHSRNAMDAVQDISDFCSQSSEYAYLRERTDNYRNAINADCCIIADRVSLALPEIAFASSDGSTVNHANIIPSTVSGIGIEEYNRILERFASTFRSFCRSHANQLRLTVTSNELTIESAIPGKKTRGFFQRYLDLHPTSYHPSDIHGLDVFICAVSRFNRGRLDTQRLRRYLLEVLGWKDKDASWCCERIETGLDILKVKRGF